MMIYRLVAASLALAFSAGCTHHGSSPSGMVETKSVTVCPGDAPSSVCEYRGADGLQAAVDQASPGSVINVRAGVYVFQSYRDIPFPGAVPGTDQVNTLRAALLIDNKDLTIRGEPGTVFDNRNGVAATAIVVHEAEARIEGLEIRDFGLVHDEDDIYDGHGIFLLNANAVVKHVLLERIPKMSLVARGDSYLEADQVFINDGHVGLWLRETAHARIRNVVMSNTEVAGVAAYANTSGRIYNSVFDVSFDDGIYADGFASLYVKDTILTRNAPYAVRSAGKGQIVVDRSVMHNNKEEVGEEGDGKVKLGEEIMSADPQFDEQFRATSAGDSEKTIGIKLVWNEGFGDE